MNYLDGTKKSHQERRKLNYGRRTHIADVNHRAGSKHFVLLRRDPYAAPSGYDLGGTAGYGAYPDYGAGTGYTTYPEFGTGAGYNTYPEYGGGAGYNTYPDYGAGTTDFNTGMAEEA